MNTNALITPTEELKMRFPWDMTCKLACKAMILGTDFDGAVEAGLVEGMEKMETQQQDFKLMRSANKSSSSK